MIKGLITNEWDRDNLNFLLNTADTELKHWHAQADADDLAYAQELLAAYSLELKVKAEELRIEAELSVLCEYNTAKSLLDAIAQK
jgi:hypothetical protein